jgi:glutathione S-transferase
MLTLYVKTGCPYCARVLEEAKTLGIHPDIKNIDEPGVAEELMKVGGKHQEPFMVDPEHQTKMYESENIVQYLDKTFGGEGQFHLHGMHD